MAEEPEVPQWGRPNRRARREAAREVSKQLSKPDGEGWLWLMQIGRHLPSPAQEISQHLSRGDSFTVLLGLAGLFVVIYVPPLSAKVTGLLAMCATAGWFVRNSFWTHGWKRGKQTLISAIAIIGMCAICIPQFVQQWRTEHPRTPMITNTVQPDNTATKNVAQHYDLLHVEGDNNNISGATVVGGTVSVKGSGNNVKPSIQGSSLTEIAGSPALVEELITSVRKGFQPDLNAMAKEKRKKKEREMQDMEKRIRSSQKYGNAQDTVKLLEEYMSKTTMP